MVTLFQVDDDTRNNAGDDEVDMDVAAQATAAGEMTAEAGEETGAATADKKKSVRMEANLAGGVVLALVEDLSQMGSGYLR